MLIRGTTRRNLNALGVLAVLALGLLLLPLVPTWAEKDENTTTVDQTPKDIDRGEKRLAEMEKKLDEVLHEAQELRKSVGKGSAVAGGDETGGNSDGGVGQDGLPGRQGGGKGGCGGKACGGQGGSGGTLLAPPGLEKLFAAMSAGNDVINIANAPFFQPEMHQFTKDNHITTGVLSRDDFKRFTESLVQNMQSINGAAVATWSNLGILRRTNIKKDGQTFYDLEDQSGSPISYALPAPGFTLEPYVGKMVQLYGHTGPRIANSSIPANYIVVSHLTLLDILLLGPGWAEKDCKDKAVAQRAKNIDGMEKRLAELEKTLEAVLHEVRWLQKTVGKGTEVDEFGGQDCYGGERGKDNLPGEEEGTPCWSKWGTLRRTSIKKDGRIIYRLEDEADSPIGYAIGAQGLNLDSYVTQKVCLYGRNAYQCHDSSMPACYTVVLQVTLSPDNPKIRPDPSSK